MREERRIVTALFADVVGSTALGERLDAEDVKLVVGGAINRAIHAIDGYGGTVQNLAGDGVLALFGTPVGHEDDPERAIRAALELMANIRQYAGEVGESWGIDDFAMRIGIHTGEVVVGPVGVGSYVQFDAMGDAVNTAARLQSMAPAGTVLVSEGTRRWTAAVFEWGEPLTLELKGKREAVVAYPVLGVARAAADTGGAPIVGRETELAMGMALIENLVAGQGAVLFIVGEPGIGKSRLAAELRRRAASRSACTWLEGRCVSYGEAFPYWPYRDLLRSWLQAHVTDPELRIRVKLQRRIGELFPGRGSEIYPYVGAVLGLNLEPEAAEQLKSLSPESLQYHTFEVLESLVARLAVDQPVVISLDDLHWADPTSLALTDRLIGLAESLPITVMIRQRAETDQGSWRLKEKAGREYRHVFHEIVLQPLQHEPQVELLRSLAGTRKVSEEVSDALIRYAVGNPFYLEQLVRSLMDRGLRLPGDGQETPSNRLILEIPQTLEGVIVARIDRLDSAWRDVVTAASVLGRTFGLELLQALTGLDMPALRTAVHHLRRLDLLREDVSGAHPAYRFTHVLIQEAAYHTLVATRQQDLHQRAAEWYEAFYRDRLESIYGLLAHHWLKAADPGKAAHYLKLAGDRARDSWALDEAVDHYQALVPLLQKAGRKREAAELLFQFAAVLHFAMRFGEANEVWQQAFDEWTPPPPLLEPPKATLVLATNQVPWDADPHPLGIELTTNELLTRQLYDPLVAGRPGGYQVPSLAERWEVSEDGLQYNFRLAPNQTWSDGSALTADDVVFSIRRALDSSRPFRSRAFVMSRLFMLENAEAYVKGEITDVNHVGVRAVNDRLVEFRLHRPVPYFLQLLSRYALLMRADLTGSGPFGLREVSTERVVVERDPSYPRPIRGNVVRVIWQGLRADAARQALANGDVDVIVCGSQDPALQAISDPDTQAVIGPTYLTNCLVFGCTQRYPSDVFLRKAIAYATDRQRLEPRLLPGQTIATGGLVPSGVLGHTPETALPFDPDAARRCLAASTGRSPLILSARSPMRPVYWEVLSECWREVLGLEIDLIEIPLSSPVNLSEIAHIYFTGGWGASTPDPEYFLRVGFHSASREPRARWSSPQFDGLIDRALAERSSPRRLALFHEADRMLVRDECIVIPLAYQRPIGLLKPWVHGWWEWDLPPLSFDELTVDARSPRFGS